MEKDKIRFKDFGVWFKILIVYGFINLVWDVIVLLASGIIMAWG